MKYGIYVKNQVFDIYEDGSEKRSWTITGWIGDSEYSMKSAKQRLEVEKELLNECNYTVEVVNSRTIKGVRESKYNGEQFAPIKIKEIVTYHIEKK